MNKRLLTSCFGLGYLPIAPGTWGSLPPAILFAAMCLSPLPRIVAVVLMFFIVTDASTICVLFSSDAIEATGKKDPSEVVVDEVAGQALALLPFSLYDTSGNEVIIIALAGFILFRLFDIIKPWPCRRLEKLPAGWGILADDLMAGFYAAIVLMICLKFFIA
jgi:phosphatidylglycerophosphatase A